MRHISKVGQATRTAFGVTLTIALVMLGAAAAINAAQPAAAMAGLPLRGTLQTFVTASEQLAPGGFIAEFMGLHIKTALIVMHVLGVTLGFGAALFLDLYLLRHLHHRAVSASTIELIKFGQKMVSIGLAALWISGIGFLVYYYMQAPQQLANPKLWAKIAIVCFLTVNGFAIHAVIAPRLKQSLGRPMLKDISLGAAMPFLAVGAISAVSWGSAFLLGLVRELNFAVPGLTLLAIYLGLVALAIMAASSLHSYRTALARNDASFEERLERASIGRRKPTA